MNNEQFQSAVLEKLEQLTTRMDSMENRMTGMEANMATKDELAGIENNLDALAAQVGALTKNVSEVKKDLGEVKTRVIRIENDHGQKLGALFDGYKLNSEKLDRIEKVVAKHEETILTKVK